MKKRFNLILLGVIVILSTMTFDSCKKYEDGPAFSLRSKTARLTGTWKVDEWGGQDLQYDAFFIFEKNGDFEMKLTYGGASSSIMGDWEWKSGKEEIKIDFDNEDFTDATLEILRLTNKEFWFETEDQGNKVKVECTKE